MTDLGIPDPLVLEGDITKNYEKFIIAFDKYAHSMGLETMAEETKIKLFLTAIGKEARDLYATFHLPATVNLETIIERYKSFCLSYRDNEVYYSYKFYKRIQLKNEPFNLFLKDIFALAKKCKFSRQDKELTIRDKIVLGIRDESVRKEIFLKGYKKLDEIIGLCQQKEKNPKARQSVPVIKAEKNNEESKKKDGQEFGSDTGQNLSDAVTSSQEIYSGSTVYEDLNEFFKPWEQVSQLNGLVDDGLEKGEVSTSTSHNNLPNQFQAQAQALVKDENQSKSPADKYKTTLKGQNKSKGEETQKSLNGKIGDDNSFEIIVISDSEDETENEPEERQNAGTPEKSTEEKSTLESTSPVLRSQKRSLGAKYYKCGKCEESFERTVQLTAHMKICFGSKNEEPVNNSADNPSTSTSFPANDSENNVKTHKSFKKPRTIDTNKRCPKCLKVFDFPCRLKQHLRRNLCKRRRPRTSATIYKCNFCRIKFKQKVNFTRHQRLHEKKHASQSSVNSRKKSTALKIHTCPVCGRAFSQKTNMTRHLQSVHKGNSIAPKNKIPNMKIIRKENGNLTIDTQIYRCNLCPRKYSHQRSLHSHVKNSHPDDLVNRSLVEETEKKRCYTCVMCCTNFDDEGKYMEHTLTHDKDLEPPLPKTKKSDCRVCGESYSDRVDLFEHILTHSIF